MAEINTEIDCDNAVLLETPLTLADVLSKGATFKIQTDFQAFNDTICDDFNVMDLNDDEDDKGEVTVSPWLKSFAELRDNMKKINDHIYKIRITKGDPTSGLIPKVARVTIDYEGYWEGDEYSFDSTILRGQPANFYFGINEVLPGIEEAVRTMHKGEVSQFVISYELLFGEKGCPPRVKPKSDALYVITLHNFIETGIQQNTDDMSKENRQNFATMIDTINQYRLKATELFKIESIGRATKLYHKAVQTLEFCKCENEDEIKEKQEQLIKLYTNLAICYNRMEKPHQVLAMCDQIKKSTDINKCSKVLFQIGRAQLKLGEYKQAKEALQKAMNLQPNNEQIIKELELLNKKYGSHKTFEKNMCKKAFQFKFTDDNNKKLETVTNNDEFKNEIKNILQEYKDNKDCNEPMILMDDYVKRGHLELTKEIAKELGLIFSTAPKLNEVTYKISKPSVN